MNVLVATSHPPFAAGGHLVIAEALLRTLGDAGHRADLLLTPQNRFGRQASAYAATWLTDAGVTHDGAPVDQVISLRFPSYAIRHPRHVCWLNHTMREYYDLWDRFCPTLSRKGRVKERVRRRLIRAADGYLLRRNVSRLFAQSKTVQSRLARFLDLASEVLYPPAPPRAYRCDDYDDYLFVVSRLTPLKRIDLVIRALAEPAARAVRCVIAGEGESGGALAGLVRELGLEGRVRLAGRVTEEELLRHLARCRAVCFCPHEEDYGFVTLEAFSSAKPVITCRDSGGPAELVQDGVCGLVCAPDPGALAEAIRRLIDDRHEAERLGQAGAAVAASIAWPATIQRLLLV